MSSFDASHQPAFAPPPAATAPTAYCEEPPTSLPPAGFVAGPVNHAAASAAFGHYSDAAAACEPWPEPKPEPTTSEPPRPPSEPRPQMVYDPRNSSYAAPAPSLRAQARHVAEKLWTSATNAMGGGPDGHWENGGGGVRG